MILLGKTAPRIKETAESMGFTNITMVKCMEESVKISQKIAEPGDTVILSVCASDMYSTLSKGEDTLKTV